MSGEILKFGNFAIPHLTTLSKMADVEKFVEEICNPKNVKNIVANVLTTLETDIKNKEKAEDISTSYLWVQRYCSDDH